jgi:hypothetical protein
MTRFRLGPALAAALFLAACRPTGVASTPGAFATSGPAASPTPQPAFTPTHSPEPIVREGPFRLIAPIPDDAIRGLGASVHLVARDGEIELLGEGILLRLGGFGWETLLEGFPGAPAGLDRAGRLWVISEDGQAISVWEGERWILYPAESGWRPLTDPQAKLASDPAGGIWLGTREDVRLFDGELWTIFTPARMAMRQTGGETTAIYTVGFASATETVWVGGCELVGPGPVGGGGVRWWDGGRWYQGPPNDLEGCVLAVEEAPNGGMWAGIDERLWTYDPADQRWDEIEMPELGEEGRAGPFLLDLAFAPKGEAWVLLAVCGGASCSGGEVLLAREDETWTKIGEAGMFTAVPVFDGRGTAWLPTSLGVYRVDQGEPELVADLQVWSATVDDEGRLWGVARRGEELGLWAQAEP